MDRFDRDRLLECAKHAIAAIVVGGAILFAVSELYGAWNDGTIRVRRGGIVSVDGDPQAFWFAVGVTALSLAMIMAVAVFTAWIRSGVRPPKPPRPPMRDETKVRKFEP